MKDLNLISKNLKVVNVKVSDDEFVEVTLIDDWNNHKRHTVDLKNQKFSCREWQVTGKPCNHALAWILSNRDMQVADFVHDYYSVAKFRAAYEDRVEPMLDRSQWPEVNLGFKIYPPLLGRSAGRPKVVRQRGCLEKRANKKKVRCKRCGDFGHFAKTCKAEMVGEDGETASTNKRLTLISLIFCHLYFFHLTNFTNFHLSWQEETTR
jgi:hypothetical protein